MRFLFFLVVLLVVFSQVALAAEVEVGTGASETNSASTSVWSGGEICFNSTQTNTTHLSGVKLYSADTAPTKVRIWYDNETFINEGGITSGLFIRWPPADQTLMVPGQCYFVHVGIDAATSYLRKWSFEPPGFDFQLGLYAVYNGSASCALASCPDADAFTKNFVFNPPTFLFNDSMDGGGGAPPTFPYVRIRVHDGYDNSTVEGINVTLSDGSSNLTSAAGRATFNHSGNVAYNITDPVLNRYFPFFSSVNASENVTTSVNVTGAFVTISAFDVLGNSTSLFSVSSGLQSNGTAGASLKLVLAPDANNTVLFNKSGYFNVSEVFETGGQDTGSFNTTRMHDARFNITAFDALDNSTINDFNVTVTNGSFSVVGSTSTGNITFLLVQGVYNFFIDAPVAAFDNATLAVNDSFGSHNFSLFPTNSILLTFFETFTGDQLFQTVTVLFTGPSSPFSRDNDSGSMVVENLTVGTWTLRASATGFEPSEYFVTVTSRSTQNLNVFLLNSTFGGETTFTIKDSTTSNKIIGAVMTMQQLINGSFVGIGQDVSDAFGVAFFSLIQTFSYQFMVEADGYATKVGNFTRTQDAYTISLSADNTQEFRSYLGDFTYRFEQVCVVGPTNFSLDVSSPLGKLEWFSASVEANGSILNSTNVTASPSGGTAITSFDLSSYGGLTVFGVYRIKSTGMSNPLVISESCFIRTIGPGNYTFADFMDYYGDDGPGELGTGLQALLLTIMAVLAAGALGAFFGMEAAMLGAAIVFILGGIFSWLDWGVVIVIDALLFGLMLVGGRR